MEFKALGAYLKKINSSLDSSKSMTEVFDTFRKTMRSLREKEIIAYHNCGTVNNNSMKLITLNPYIFCRGMNVDKWVVKYFSNSKWAKVQRQKVKQSD